MLKGEGREEEIKVLKIGLVLSAFLVLGLMASNFPSVLAQEGDDPSTIPPAGEIGDTNIVEYEDGSFVWEQIVGNASGMDEYRWWNQDFGWTHSGFNSAGKKIISVTLEIRAWDVDNYGSDPVWEHNLVYGNTIYLGELAGASDVWSNTIFDVPTDLLEDGTLDVYVDVDSTHTGALYWAVIIDWSKLTIHWDWIPVGGVWTQIDKLELLTPWISLTLLITATTISVVYVRHKKKKQT